jgi:Ca-activated chloride channel family protein
MNWRAIPFAAYLTLCPHFWIADAFASECSASLVTGIDVSASTGADGVAMQVAGIEAALQSPAVLSAFSSQGCVRIAVFLWSDGPSVVVLPWSDISSAEDAANAGANLRKAAAAYEHQLGSLTNVSGALETAEAMLGQIPPTGRQVVNIVSDGEDNVGEGPLAVSHRLRAAGVTINAVLFGPSATVEQYYRSNVTNGFTLRVGGADDFAAVYRSKFILDLSMVTE